MGTALRDIVCGLCHDALRPTESHFRASGDFLPESDALHSLCNAPMHWACYEGWPHRTRFARAHVQAWRKANHRNPFWWTVLDDGAVYISANPLRGVEQASVRLYAVGSDIRVPLPQWGAFLDSPSSVTPGLSELELRELGGLIPDLRAKLPSDHALVDAIDPAEKQPKQRVAR